MTNRAFCYYCSQPRNVVRATKMSIAVLPVELISKICNYLDFQQLVAVRLSCRALYKNTLENFAKAFYRRIRFIVTSESLHELEELSKSNGLREHVQELWMIPIVFDGIENLPGMISISSKSCRQVKGDEQESRYAIQKVMLADNRNLLESEAFSVRLRECLDRFKNIQTIGLAHYRTEFLLDPRQKTVPFLGRRQIISRIDFRFDIRKLNSLALSKLFLALCSSSCRPRKLHTCDSNFCGDIGPRIALSEEQFDSLLSTLEGLEDLHLCIDLNEAAWLKFFRKLAPQLEVLILSQDHMPSYLVQDEMSAYPAKSYVGHMFHDISFTRLRKLHIHELDINFSSLRSLLLGVKKSLVTLTVQRVTMRSENLQENETSVRYASPASQLTTLAVNPISPSYQPTVPSHIPTVPSFDPNLPSYHPTVPSFQPTLPSFQPTLPSFSTSSLYTPTISPLEYGPAPLSDLPASETASAESAPQLPQHSSTSESSESSIEEYPNTRWLSTYYYPYEPPESARGSVCPTWETVMAWKRNEEEITCVSRFLDILQNELSLEKLSLEDIICDGNYYYFERVDNGNKQSGQVEFDIRKANLSLKDWISRLRPIASCPADRVLELKEDKEMEGWFDKMIGKDSGSLNRLDCDCNRKKKPFWGCPFGCHRY
ncbi:unnamed protein product [Penicillium nalgiovense]|uniref:F-box domain-containing protein n=1 Tax=Penicillium nalgiovense TaxID=60175 RepID=A0A9W4INF4_PENNA|nr:unnamed protein product [Penicillium nalgiovense]CAG7949729.1 unnamed protein product [Penicillium nalgiovense]CAG7963550.1 unnamed protein product [Penicillium nalgiovense]CAG7988028.1 unnamed protein product [Penicillium nalgiovense]CAG8003499.1 unnamed protein product [Penicillium nalgiovense]